METMHEILNNNTPVKKRRGRPAKIIDQPDLNKTNSTVSDIKEKKMVGKSKISKVLAIEIGGPKIIKPPVIKSKQMKNSNTSSIDIRNHEQDMEYKTELHRYLKERLKQGKAGIKLNESIKKLEDKLKALH